MIRIPARILNALPPRVRGRVEFALGQHSVFFPWGGPFNGQTLRRELCRRLIVQMQPDLIAETGTYRGTTTEFLASFHLPVKTFETNEQFHEFSRLRLSHFDNVELILGSSEVELNRLGSTNVLKGNIFAYLDAHWYRNLPLLGEIKAIQRYTKSFVILVDDFQVPNSPDYEHDDYGATGALTLEFIRPHIDTGTEVFFPILPATHETGIPRGYCFLAKGDRNIDILRSYSELKWKPLTDLHPSDGASQSRP